MSDTDKPAPNAAPAAEPLAFDVADLIARAPEFLGVERHVVAGALAHLDPQDQLTVEGAEKAINAWLRPAGK